MRARTAALLSLVAEPRWIALSSNPAECALPRSAASTVESTSTTAIPAMAATWAIPAPIMPAPTTPKDRTLSSGKAGRRAPLSSASLFKNKLRIMALAVGSSSTEVKARASTFKAVSNPTKAPS